MVGSPHNIQCVISTVVGVTLDSVIVDWIGPTGSSIISDNRLVIAPLNFSSNSYTNTITSSLEFVYLMEGDEGRYVCNVSIIQANESMTFQLSRLQSE